MHDAKSSYPTRAEVRKTWIYTSVLPYAYVTPVNERLVPLYVHNSAEVRVVVIVKKTVSWNLISCRLVDVY
jgi:hypothetical protein